MVLLHYILGIAFFYGVYLLGKLMVGESRKWADLLASRYASRGALGKVFTYCGWIVQVIAMVWGFLDAVAVLVLAT
ncbi:MAG TPA: hypothetical protein VHD85_07410 [Terracidiphilus sp.]|jgi:hypothetical protein|nr:hypothetical protein [Terracidiphilus sp.]